MAKDACAGKQPATKTGRLVFPKILPSLPQKMYCQRKTKTHNSLNFVTKHKVLKILLNRNLFFNQRPYFAQNMVICTLYFCLYLLQFYSKA